MLHNYLYTYIVKTYQTDIIMSDLENIYLFHHYYYY